MTEPLYDLPPMSLEEYLAFEETNSAKLEYVDGHVYAMSGAHSRHERIAGNVFARLWLAAGDGPCRAYGSNLKVRAPKDRVYYPDVMSVCTARDDDGLIVDDPCLLVEVTSPSTARTDHTEKLDAYRQIPSLQAYLVVEQNRREVHHWRRAPNDEWRQECVAGHGSVVVPCPAVILTLDEIYARVAMPPSPIHRVREPEPSYGGPG